MGNDRIKWIDSVRGALILLIVLGHVIGGAIKSGFIWGLGWTELNRIIYMFHVPAFFVLTGFIWKSAKMGNAFWPSMRTFVAKKFNRLMVPYYVFGLSSAIIYCITVERSFASLGMKLLSLLHGGGWGDAFRANSVLWFLPVMFSTVICYRILDSLLDWKRMWWGQLLLSIAFLYVHRFCVYRLGGGNFPLGISMAMRYMSYLVLGRLAGRLTEAYATKIPFAIRPVVGIVVFATMSFFDRKLFAGLIGDWGSWLIMVVVGVAMSLSFMTVIRCVDCRALRLTGLFSLGIMLMHKFVVVPLESNAVSLYMQWNLLNGISSVAAVTLVAAGCSLVASICIRKCCPIILGERGVSN